MSGLLNRQILLAPLSILLLALLFPHSIPMLNASAASCNPVPHGSVLIKSDSDFTTANGVVSGSGTPSDPYVIANLRLNDLSFGYGLKVDNSHGKITKYFTIQCIQSSFDNAPPSGAKLIWILDVHTTTMISDVAANSGEEVDSTGIVLDSSSNVTLDNISINKFGHDGIVVDSSNNVTIIESKLKAMHNGVTLRNSHDINIGKPCNLSNEKGCNEFTYDDGRGIYVLNSYNVQIQYTITSADDSGGILLDGKGTYNVKLINGISSGNGPICPSGSPTGERVDTIAGFAIINGAHDITMTSYTLNGNSHYDMMNGGDGLYINPCTGLTESLPITPSGGANISVNGNCYHKEFGFNPVPTSTC